MSPDTPGAPPETGSADTAAWPWSELGLAKMPPDTKDIRRAYAAALKQIDQARDAEGFAALRHAYDAAMAIREGRSERNAQRRARKAAKFADLTPQFTDPPAHVRADTAAQDAQIAIAAAIEAMVQDLLDENSTEPAHKRISAALANPLGQSTEVQPILRDACAQLIRTHQRPDFNGNFALSPQITAECLLALDARFTWLNDYIAFRQAFGFDTALQHELGTRAYGNIQMASTLAVKPQSWLAAIFSNGGVRVFAVIILIKLAGWIFDLVTGTPYESTATTLVVIMADIALMAWLYTSQRRKRQPKIAALIALWFGLFLPLVLFAPDTNAGAQDRPLLLIWMICTAVLAAAWLLAPAWQWLARRFAAANRR